MPSPDLPESPTLPGAGQSQLDERALPHSPERPGGSGRLRALEWQLRSATPAGRIPAWIDLCWALRHSDPKRALAHLKELRESNESPGMDSSEARPRTQIVEAACLRRLGQNEEADRLAKAALEQLERSGASEWQARAREVLADLGLRDERLQDALDWIAPYLASDSLEAETRCELGLIWINTQARTGRFREALEHVDRLLAETPRKGAEDCYGRLWTERGSALLEMGDLQGALSAFRIAQEALQAPESRCWQARVLHQIALCHMALHSWDEATRVSREAIEAVEGDPSDPIAALSRAILAEVHLRRGELEAASEVIEDVESDHPVVVQLRGTILASQGRYAEAEQVLRAHLAEGERPACGHVGQELTTRIGLAKTLVAAGQAREAQQELEPYLEVARNWGNPGIEANLHATLAIAAEKLGDWKKALEHERLGHIGQLALQQSHAGAQLRNQQVLLEVDAVRQREQLLEESRAQLEMLVRERTDELERALRQLRSEQEERLHQDRERQLLIEELRQAQKMEAMGRLAGGVAHDFNNLLTVIQGYAELLLEDLPPGSTLRMAASEVAAAATRAGQLTAQLLSFSRKQPNEPKPVEPNSVLHELRRMLRRLIGEDIELGLRFDSHAGVVSIDPGQLEQVVVNLVINARDAMPEGGQLTLRTFRRTLPDNEHAALLPPGDYLGISVQDTGVGMSKAVRERVFEPFFTTKGPGKGTGLGLSTAYGIVQQNGGELRVDSELHRGSTFTFFLPRIDAEVPDDPHKPGVAETELGSGTLLLVEDEPSLRRMISEGLRYRGYEVLEAGGGDEALQVYNQVHERLDLVISDLVMPGMSGAKLLEELRASEPTLPFVLISGFPDRFDAAALQRSKRTRFLPKPFTISALSRAVGDSLEAAASGGG